MNPRTILPLIAAAVLAALPQPASAFDPPRNGVTFHLADDDHIGGHWRWIGGRWVRFWAVHGEDRWDDDDDDHRWGSDRWDDDDDDRWSHDDDDDDDGDD